MPSDRREFLVRSVGAAGVLAAWSGAARGQRPLARFGSVQSGVASAAAAAAPANAAGATSLDARPGATPVITPDGASLPAKLIAGVRVFHLVAEPVTHEFAPGLLGECWGYNGRVHGPTLEAIQGEPARIYVTNRLPVSTTVHWHGQRVPSGMDGVGGLTQRPIEPGETFKYEFTPPDAGTFMYHSHHDEMTQMAMGLMGMFVVHPREPEPTPVDRDYCYMLSEWKIEPGTRRPDPNEMVDFNVLTLNARIFPGTTALVARRGERVRIRIGNLSAMDHHPIHLHGHSFEVVATDGGPVPASARFRETSVLVPVGAVRVIEFTADNPGDWALHCHMTHHVMTQMGHGLPNLIGSDPGRFDDALSRHVPAFDQVGGDMAMESGGAAAHGGAASGGSSAQDDGDSSIPRNSLPMMGGTGPHGYITMGGMFTVLKVRDELPAGADPGWYSAPSGTQADAAAPGDLERDGIVP